MTANTKSTESVRKKSPRAPSISLDEALDRALKVYDKERLNPASADVVAQGMGYKDANNGRALAAIASLRYFGLIERLSDGQLAVSQDVEGYKYAPSEEVRLAYLRRFVAAPALLTELLEVYASGLPSDGALRYELIQRGFLPATAEGLVGVVRRSFDFAKVYAQASRHVAEPTPGLEVADAVNAEASEVEAPRAAVAPAPFAPLPRPLNLPETQDPSAGHDRIPVRLSGGRRAWLLIPPVFCEADKQRLKAQIDLLLTEDEEDKEDKEGEGGLDQP